MSMPKRKGRKGLWYQSLEVPVPQASYTVQGLWYKVHGTSPSGYQSLREGERYKVMVQGLWYMVYGTSHGPCGTQCITSLGVPGSAGWGQRALPRA